MPSIHAKVPVRRSILVVDDIELNRILTSAVLEHAAYDVDNVADGVSALRAVATKIYDLVLMDLDMPDLAGHATAAAIRRPGGATPPKLVALSAKNGLSDRELSADIGMDGHIARPISPTDLLRAVDLALRPSSATSKVGDAPETWNRAPYLDLADQLGHGRLEATLVQLLEHCEVLLHALVDQSATEDTIQQKTHDLASVAGMLGFDALSRRCLDVLALTTSVSRRAMMPSLEAILQRTIAVLARHVASVSTSVAA